MMKKYLTLILPVIALSCDLLKDESGEGSFGPNKSSYINTWVQPTGLNPVFLNWDSTVSIEPSMLQLRLSADYPSDWEITLPSDSKIENFKAELEDYSFDKEKYFEFKYLVFIDKVESVRLFIDKSFGEVKEQGDITGMIEVEYAYPGLFVKNGYSYEDVVPQPNSTRGDGYIIEPLTDFNNRVNKLGIGTGFYFHLKEAPTKTDTFQFTIRYEFEGDRVFETTTPPVILQGLEE